MQKIIAFLKTDINKFFAKKQKSKAKTTHTASTGLVLFLVLAVLFCGFFWGMQSLKYPPIQSIYNYLTNQTTKVAIEVSSDAYQSQVPQEQAIIGVVKTASPAVVSIIISKEMPIYEKYYEKQFQDLGQGIGIEFDVPKTRQNGTEKQQVGGGTGFFVSADGMVITNKHVASETKAEYTIITSDNKKYPAVVLARDPFFDLAILKIEQDKIVNQQGEMQSITFPVLPLGNSNSLQAGQSVIAIGNALGEFTNTVSVGIISGLMRRITAEGVGFSEVLENVIQTDAAINKGNSGGPLLNLKGQVIGVNVAMAELAQSIGFAIPINDAKRAITQVKQEGRIVYPFLGVVYQLVTPELQELENITVDYGAWIVNKPNEYSVVKGSSADIAGIKKGDIVLEVNNKRVDTTNTLAKLIRQYLPGDIVTLKVLRGEEELLIEVVLGEKSSDDE